MDANGLRRLVLAFTDSFSAVRRTQGDLWLELKKQFPYNENRTTIDRE